MNKNCRILFEKTGRAAYISHLDLMHTIQRGFIRAGIKLKHTEGFNPHPYMSIALPLPVCCESVCEIMDYVSADDTALEDVPKMLNAVLPEGIRVLHAYVQANKVKEIKWVSVSGVFEFDDVNVKTAADKLNEFFSNESIIINKKTKRGMADVDIAPNIKSIEFNADNGSVNVSAVLAGQNPSLNPNHLITAIKTHIPEFEPDYSLFKRENIYFDNMNEFR